MKFLLLDGQADLVGALVAGNEIELHAQQVFLDDGVIDQRASGAGAADDELLFEHLPIVLDGRIAAHDAHDAVLIGIANEAELGRVELVEALASHQRVEERAGQDNANRCPVFGGDRVEIARSAQAAGAGHVLNDDVRIAWNMFLQMARDEPRIDIDAAAGRRARDHRDILALVEIRHRFLRLQALGCKGCEPQGGEHQTYLHWTSPISGHFPRSSGAT